MKATVWSRYNCTFCDQAKMILDQKGYTIEEKKIGDGYTREELLEMVPTAKSVPQIFINDKHIGGFDDLKKYFEDTAGGFGEGQL